VAKGAERVVRVEGSILIAGGVSVFVVVKLEEAVAVLVGVGMAIGTRNRTNVIFIFSEVQAGVLKAFPYHK
jgi:hypothetical protein